MLRYGVTRHTRRGFLRGPILPSMVGAGALGVTLAVWLPVWPAVAVAAVVTLAIIGLGCVLIRAARGVLPW